MELEEFHFVQSRVARVLEDEAWATQTSSRMKVEMFTNDAFSKKPGDNPGFS
jgi:hypothetical protein